MINNKPNNYKELLSKSRNSSDYLKRIEAIEELSQYDCKETKDILYNLMKHDLVYEVSKIAFLKLQSMGQDVKLPRKRKIKYNKERIYKLYKKFNDKEVEFSIEKFKEEYKKVYPIDYDVYLADKGEEQFNKWLGNILSNSVPKKYK